MLITPSPRPARVRTGLERLLDRPDPVRGLRVGLVVNPSSITRDLEHASVALKARRGVRLAALFGPEHGIAADAQDLVEVGHSRDHQTGLPVHSLYGETRVPTPEMLAGVDAMVFDVQDVGARYYTFVYTMLHVMEACARERKRVVVLDRPNPIGGDAVEGNVLDPEYRSFVGMHPLAVRHGMTAGELALLFREELALDVDLQVVPMRGWRRKMAYEDTGLPCEKVFNGQLPFDDLTLLIGRETILQQAVLCIENFDYLLTDDRHQSQLRSLLEMIHTFSHLRFLTGSQLWKPMELLKRHFFINLEISIPDDSTRKQLWQSYLNKNQIAIEDMDLGELANKFRFTPGQIQNAITSAQNLARWHSTDNGQITQGKSVCIVSFPIKF